MLGLTQKLEFTMERKAQGGSREKEGPRRQECEAAAHITPTHSQEAEMTAGAQLTFSDSLSPGS